MKLINKKWIRNICAGVFSFSAIGSAAVANTSWPTQPVRLLIAGPPGGTADILARLLAEGLQKNVSQPVIVESKVGASGGIAIRDLSNTGKNGHTFLVIQSGAVTEIPLAQKVNYKPFDDLKPLAQLSRTGLVLVANNELGLKTLDDVLSYGKAQKEGVHFASYATGMRGHTQGVLLGKLNNIDMQHVGYKGSPQALVDLMSGHFPLMFDGVSTSLPHIKNQRITPIAVSYPTRIGELPDVPTFKELGYPELSRAGWFAVWSHPDAPTEIQEKIRELTLEYFQSPTALERVKAIGMEPGGLATTEELMIDLKETYEQQEALLTTIGYEPE